MILQQQAGWCGLSVECIGNTACLLVYVSCPGCCGNRLVLFDVLVTRLAYIIPVLSRMLRLQAGRCWVLPGMLGPKAARMCSWTDQLLSCWVGGWVCGYECVRVHERAHLCMCVSVCVGGVWGVESGMGGWVCGYVCVCRCVGVGV